MAELTRSCKYIAKLEVDQYNQSFRKLTNITNLSISDEEFIYNVNCDIENFVEQRHNNGVLLFPPVNNFRRFLIHQTCENFRNKYDIFTFSVGQGPLRRTVICFKNQLLDPHKYNDSVAAANFETRHKSTTSAQLKSWRSDNRRIESANFSNTNSTGTTTNKRDRKMGVERNIIDTNKISKSNASGLYRPPALRNHSNETLKIDVAEAKELTTNESSNCEIKTATSLSNSKADNNSIATTTSVSCNSSPIHKFENVNINNSATSTQQTSIYKSQQQQQQVEDKLKQPQRQQQTRRERRPDRAVYIPRARRSQTTPRNTATIQMQQPAPTQLPALAPKTTNDTSKSLNQQFSVTSDDTTTASVNQKPSSKADEAGKINICDVFSNNCDNNLTASTSIKKKEKLNKESKESREQRREQRLLRKLSVVSAQHIQNYKNNENLNDSSINIISSNYNSDEITKQQIQSTSLINNVGNFSELSNNIIKSFKGFDCDSSEEIILNQERQPSDTIVTCVSESLLENQINGCTEIVNTSNISDANSIINNSYINTMPKLSLKTKSTKLKSEELNQSKVPNLCIEDVALQQLPTKCDVEEQELQRASKEINRSNRRIIKQTFTSDVLLIPDHVNEEHEDKPEVAEGINKLETNIASRTTRQIDSNTDDEDEDDWENMYNDSGDCLDPKIMQELTACVGKCKIELPKMDYSAYLTKQSILNEEEFPHVLEVSNFPVEFKNQDLLMVFSQYKESGFDIKWVDDTHALAVFSSSRIAAEVLTMGHPFVVLKPLAEATVESRLKAKKCAASLQPYRPRPETCAALARRLVTGALGVRLKTAAAERENEKRVLREAKERKLLAAKQRDEVWES